MFVQGPILGIDSGTILGILFSFLSYSDTNVIQMSNDTALPSALALVISYR